MSEISLENYKNAYRKLMLKKATKGFKIHATVYGCINACLVTINMLTMPQFPWFLFPLAGWGAGLASHYYFGVRRYPKELEAEQLEAERMAEREQH
jgi:2TM domain-containing protein